ncbi:hypothetical protein ElyMa_006703700 [Elysia marginata]|uniref:Uncharacterized protein n=1 Tax=Elysia marginata TaxID=1093978 RepID=A0AAV4IVZ5_9GAST|nr:hypothetical protein ElyMa_006703700 [Elysia marginata]
MAPKKAKKKGDEPEPEPEPEEEREPSPYDPYKGLRFQALPRKAPAPRKKQRTTKIPVLKLKPVNETKQWRTTPISVIPSHLEGSGAQKIINIVAKAPSQLSMSSVFSGLKDKKVQNYALLDPTAGSHQKLTPWVSAGETALKRLPKLALLPRPSSGGNLRLLRLERQHKESHSLARFEEVRAVFRAV